MEIAKSTLRIKNALEALTAFNATPGQGVTRFPFTDAARQASDYIQELMASVGLKVSLDNTGSVIGRLEGQVPETIMTGSHLDSVQHGGAYDGIAGVVTSIEALRLFQEQGIKPYYSYEVIATNDEEGSRFSTGLFTGKVLLGQLTVDDIKGYRDAQGISVYQAMEAYGLKPEEINQHVRKDLKAFLEVHIEQGPLLEMEQKNIGIVDAIVGMKRALITIHGRADHSGTMPMHLRKDAMEVAAKVIARIGDRARKYPPAVATVGNLTVEPNIVNIVPSRVKFFIDFRATEAAVIKTMYQEMLADLEQYCQELGMRFTAEETLWVEPVQLQDGLKQYIESSCQKRNFSHMHIISGAGHDAQVFGAQLPAAMIFVPSIGGRSHCPEENTDPATLAMAAQVLCDTLLQINTARNL